MGSRNLSAHQFSFLPSHIISTSRLSSTWSSLDCSFFSHLFPLYRRHPWVLVVPVSQWFPRFRLQRCSPSISPFLPLHSVCDHLRSGCSWPAWNCSAELREADHSGLLRYYLLASSFFPTLLHAFSLLSPGSPPLTSHCTLSVHHQQRCLITFLPFYTGQSRAWELNPSRDHNAAWAPPTATRQSTATAAPMPPNTTFRHISSVVTTSM